MQHIYFGRAVLSARKLLLQRACDRRETRAYYGAPHGECHKRADGRRVITPIYMGSTALFPSLTKRRHVFCGADGEYEVPENCAAPEIQETIALSCSTADVACLNMWWKRGSETESSHIIYLYNPDQPFTTSMVR